MIVPMKSITDAMYQAMNGGQTGALCTVHLDPAPDDTDLPCVVLFCPGKEDQEPFFRSGGGVDDLAPWKGKVMVFSERTTGPVNAQAIFDAVVADLNTCQKFAGMSCAIESTEGPTQSEQFLVATINFSLIG